MTTTWHAGVETLRAYAHDEIDPVVAVSVEAHLLACATCRNDLAGVCDHDALRALWREVEDVIDQPSPSPVERVVRALGVRDTTARIVAATPLIRPAWILALVAVIGAAVIATHQNHGDPIAYLWLAPLVPIAGVATAFGPGMDPVFDIGAASPIDGLRLLLIRVVAVETVALLLLLAATLFLPDLRVLDLAWLLPALAVSIGTLALGTFIGVARAGAAVALTWFAVVPISVWLASPETDAVAQHLAVFGTWGQTVSLMVAAVGAVVFLLRRRRFDAPVTGRDLV
jgi:hypothetical protein